MMWTPAARRKREKLLGEVAQLEHLILRMRARGCSEAAIQVVRNAANRVMTEASDLYARIKEKEDKILNFP